MKLPEPKNADRLSYVKGLLAMHRIKNHQIAVALGVTDTAVCLVLSGRAKSRRIQAAIAGSLNMDHQAVWGEKA